MKKLILIIISLITTSFFAQETGTLNTGNEENDQNEYSESEYKEPEPNQYGKNHPIQKSVKNYTVFKTQRCNEKKGLYFNYLEDFECNPSKAATIIITINIHLNDPMYDEASVTIKNLVSKQTDQFPIEKVELSEEGNKEFHFSVINQPHTFLLDETKKKIIWHSEWGHWKVVHYYK